MEWLSRIAPGTAPDGSPILSVLGKRTYRFANNKTAWLDEEQVDFIEADEYGGQGNPQKDAMRLESDLVAYKPMTDFILIGKAHVPGGKKAGYLDVGVQVANGRKIARIFGNRKAYVTATGIAFSEPEPFTDMPLDYSRAYGGQDIKSDEGFTYSYLKNPVGRGFVIKNTPQAIQDLALPNIEDAQKLLTPQSLVIGRFDRWPAAPEPVAFGCTSKNSHPRFTMAGLPPEDWTRAEADRQRSLRAAPEVGTAGSPQPSPIPPMLNPMFWNGAAPGLRFPYLKGDETVKLAHLDSAFAQFAFTLPGIRPTAVLDVGEGPEFMQMMLHTVVLYKETNQVTLTWRGCSYYGGLEAMKEFTMLDFSVKEA
ncbi:MAG: DUF2169 domain-containing protein [Fibrobacterota bacterium]|nr:DUF2169 domain-containing protein [Fibrobacterota bacterium]